MNAARRTVLEALILGALGVVVAITANAVRASGSIKFSKNYFDKGTGRVMAASLEKPARLDHLSPEAARGISSARLHDSSDTSAQATDREQQYAYQVVTFDQVVAIFNDPNTAVGGNVFVDARNDREYEAGHIPGAIQADHYRLEDYIDMLLDHAESAEKIIVYCNGGNCEDSIFLCSDMLDFEIPCDKLYLYPGGWQEWTDKGMPVAKGRE